jgi:hypothetical protein
MSSEHQNRICTARSLVVLGGVLFSGIKRLKPSKIIRIGVLPEKRDTATTLSLQRVTDFYPVSGVPFFGGLWLGGDFSGLMSGNSVLTILRFIVNVTRTVQRFDVLLQQSRFKKSLPR